MSMSLLMMPHGAAAINKKCPKGKELRRWKKRNEKSGKQFSMSR